MRVVLKRGRLGDKEFPEESVARAKQRASSLIILHGCNYSTPPKGIEDKVIIVDASIYYDGGSRNWSD